MAQSPDNPSADTPSPGAAAASSPAKLATDGIDGVMTQSRLMTDLATTFGMDLLRFATRRMQAHVDLYAGLVRCRTMQDLLDQQVAFMQRAGSDYADELSAMTQLARPPGATAGAKGTAD
jgi:hypothetical protein